MNGTAIVTCARSGSTKSGAVAELLDDAEDVVPAPGVEAGGVLAQLVEDLLHLERGEDRLDEHRRADRAARNAERVLREDEDVVPQPRLEVALELRQVEVRARCRARALARVVEEVEPEVEEAAPTPARRRRARAPRRGASRAAARRASRCVRPSRYALPSGVVKRERAADRVHAGCACPSTTFSQVGDERVLEVGHEDARARVERVDHHLALDRPGDLDAPVVEVRGRRRDAPVAVRGCRASGRKSSARAGVEALPARRAGAREQLAARVAERRACSRPTNASASGVSTRSECVRRPSPATSSGGRSGRRHGSAVRRLMRMSKGERRASGRAVRYLHAYRYIGGSLSNHRVSDPLSARVPGACGNNRRMEMQLHRFARYLAVLATVRVAARPAARTGASASTRSVRAPRRAASPSPDRPVRMLPRSSGIRALATMLKGWHALGGAAIIQIDGSFHAGHDLP